MADGDRVVGFDFVGMAAEWLGVPTISDPVVLAMQYAAGAATPPEMPAARRLVIAEAMQEFFRAMASKASAEIAKGGER